jgi:hypothetical protein
MSKFPYSIPNASLREAFCESSCPYPFVIHSRSDLREELVHNSYMKTNNTYIIINLDVCCYAFSLFICKGSIAQSRAKEM